MTTNKHSSGASNALTNWVVRNLKLLAGIYFAIVIQWALYASIKAQESTLTLLAAIFATYILSEIGDIFITRRPYDIIASEENLDIGRYTYAFSIFQTGILIAFISIILWMPLFILNQYILAIAASITLVFGCVLVMIAVLGGSRYERRFPS